MEVKYILTYANAVILVSSMETGFSIHIGGVVMA
jgi:hypothetical protein